MYLGIVAQGSFYKQIIMYWRTELGKIDVFWSEYESNWSSYIKSLLKILIVTIFHFYTRKDLMKNINKITLITKVHSFLEHSWAILIHQNYDHFQ